MDNLKFFIAIGCENAAFEPGQINAEVARILRGLASRMVSNDADYYTLRDSNGNTVGRAEFDSVGRLALVASSSLHSER